MNFVSAARTASRRVAQYSQENLADKAVRAPFVGASPRCEVSDGGAVSSRKNKSRWAGVWLILLLSWHSQSTTQAHGELNLTILLSSGSMEIRWEPIWLVPENSSLAAPQVRPEYEVQSSADLRTWLPVGPRIQTSLSDPTKPISFVAEPGVRAAFFRVVGHFNLRGADLHSADLRGADLRGVDLQGANLAGADLTGASLGDANFTAADLRGAQLRRANLAQANLTAADLTEANLEGASFQRAILLKANLTRAQLPLADFTDALLQSANFTDANLAEVAWNGADLSGAILSGTDFLAWIVPAGTLFNETVMPDGTLRTDSAKWRLMVEIITMGANVPNLETADLSEMDLRGAELNRASLGQADLRRANLSHAELSGADLNQADLREANLTYADLSGAGLAAAKLPGADLSGAILRNADLTDADLQQVNLTGADLRNAKLPPVGNQIGIVFANTIMPDGTVRSN